METAQDSKKTGATPAVEEGIGGGEVLGVAETKIVIVRLRDGHGQEMIKLAVVSPDGATNFFEDKVLGKPVQAWVKKGILRFLGRAA